MLEFSRGKPGDINPRKPRSRTHNFNTVSK
jgi:hypothetical protein